MINVKDQPTPVLVKAYNYCAVWLGLKEVTKFQDRATAEDRTRKAVLLIVDKDKRPVPFGPADPDSRPADTRTDAQKHVDNVTADLPIEAAAIKAARSARQPAAGGADIELNFGERPGSKREALIKVLVAHRNAYVDLDDLVAATYGTRTKTEAGKGPLMMVMKGMNVMIEKNKLPVTIRKQKEGKQIGFGLFDKTAN